ncbi:MAG: class I SAM-dependent methyltransferase [bacterium]|nr:class I SAM-dependent methyltransferase [bacterium]
MRSFAHWSLRYAWDRGWLSVYEWTHRDAPWLTPDATSFLETHLQKDHVGFEWGAGRSTAWLAQRVARLTSVETNKTWLDTVSKQLETQGLSNAHLRYVDGQSASHAGAIAEEKDASLDFVLVDGLQDDRDACALAALPKIRGGGMLVVDDVHRYLPSDSRSPLALGTEKPGATETWTEVARLLDDWPCVWTSSGVTDTAIWTKPGAPTA